METQSLAGLRWELPHQGQEHMPLYAARGQPGVPDLRARDSAKRTVLLRKQSEYLYSTHRYEEYSTGSVLGAGGTTT